MTRMATPVPTVLLGPKTDLHMGAHWAVVDSLRARFEFRIPESRHHFVPAGERLLSPHKNFSAGEFLDLGGGPEAVHSFKWPVIGRGGWIVDHDDFASATLIGRHALNPDARLSFRDRPEPFASWISMRFENMVTAYCHPSCVAVLFWTEHTRRRGLELCRKMLPQAEASLEEKARVVYFVPRPSPREIVAQKWAGRGLKVIFCGRDYEQKNGAMALRVFSRLAERAPSVHITYIGRVPAAARERYAKLFERMEYHESVPRREMPPFFERSHILFHPARFESYGSVYAEAVASGLAIITARGGLMGHVPEIVSEEVPCLIDRDTIGGEEEEALAFEEMLARLTADRAQAERLGWRNYHEITSGRLSWQRMCEQLEGLYRECGLRAVSGESGLTLDDLPCRAGSGELTMTVSEVMRDEDYWRAAWNLPHQAILI